MNKFIFFLCIIILLNGCTKYNYDLGNGMKAIDISSGNYMIINSTGDILVEPRVKKFCKIGNYIIGYRVDPLLNNPDGSSDFLENLGYFELNMITEKVTRNNEYNLEHVRAKCGYLIRPIF